MNKETYMGIIELPDDIIYLTQDDNNIYSNGLTNAGYYHLDEWVKDEYLTEDENIQRVMEELTNE